MKKRTVQLDKNSGGKKLRDLCNEQGVVDCFLLPQGFRDRASDAEVAEFAIRHGNLTLTFDRTFCLSAARALAGRNPGLLLLREDDAAPRQISTKTAPKHLKRFKDEFPEWHLVPWRNSFVELTPSLVYVYHTSGASPVQVGMVDSSHQDWQATVSHLLEKNAHLLAAENQEDA